MKTRFFNKTFLPALLLSGVCLTAFLPQEIVDPDPPKGLITAYLGNSTYSGGKIPKRVFDSLLVQGITARDSVDTSFQVHSFVFSYGERKLYEDSIGNLIVMTDYLTEYCTGSMLNPAIQAIMPTRSKKGDTVYFDNIKVLSKNGQKQYGAKSMCFVLTP